MNEKQKLNENIELHNELNPVLWDSNSELKPDIKSGIYKIVNQFSEELSEYELNINILDILLLGSNASYNYTGHSDIDVHLIVDTSKIDSRSDLLLLIYNQLKSAFNSKYEIKIKGLEVELYVEDMHTSALSNGIYSLKTGWVKYPDKKIIPEIDMDDEIDFWKNWAERIIKKPTIHAVESFVNEMYLLRKKSIMKDGEYGKGNLVFKGVRNLGYLDKMKDLRNDLISKDLTVESLKIKR